VAWGKPSQGRFKLNTDGSSFGASGIIRDDHGNLIHVCASPLGVGSNNRAELLALLYGLKACKALRIGYMEVELDLQVVVSWWNQRRCGVWYLEDFWEEIFGLLDSMSCL
jgi:ribonuclease HI